MEGDKQDMVSSFLEIAVGQTPEIAVQFLQATSWKLEDALQLFYLGLESNTGPSLNPQAQENSTTGPGSDVIPNYQKELEYDSQANGDEVRAPLPVVRETLYDDGARAYGTSRIDHSPRESSSIIAFRNFDDELKYPRVWETGDRGSNLLDKPRDLASLYRPPFHLLFNGSFENAKSAASIQEKWLLVNIQSTKEFSSHMLNRDTWSNEAVSQTISTNFIFWQVYDDTSEGRKVCTYYKLDSIPVVLVIDPITGQKMKSWCGMVQPESLLEDLVPFMDGDPRHHHVKLSHKRPRGDSSTSAKTIEAQNEVDDELQRAIAASLGSIHDSGVLTCNGDKESSSSKEDEKPSIPILSYPILPEEPVGDKSLLCRIGFRLPDGRRVQRHFLRSDPTQFLWSFCASHLAESEKRSFRLMQAIPGSKTLDYDSKLSIEESGLANSMISVAWE